MSRFNRVKIVCTLGPSTSDPENLKNFKKDGMDLIRLNGSHATKIWIKKTVLSIRRELPMTPILIDLPGSKIRIKNLNHKRNISVNDEVIFTCDGKYKDNKKIILNNDEIYKKVKLNSKIFADDGNLIFKVLKKKGKDIFCKVLEDGFLTNGTGISFNIKNIQKDLISKNDISLIKFLKKINPDFIGVSNAKNAIHITQIRNLIKNNKVNIIAKIENMEGIKNLENILKVSDGIMIDRGDLSLSSEIVNIVTIQKDIIEISKKFGKPVIVATELLSTMIKKTVPSKSEIADITNAVYDGCSATMLSNETVLGKNPRLIIKEMKKIINSASLHQLKKESLKKKKYDISEITCRAAVDVSKNLPISKIIVITKTGYAARLLSFHNLKQQIFAVTNCKNTARSFNLIKGTEGTFLKINFFQKSTDHIIDTINKLYKIGKINSKDLILVVAVGYPKKGNKMNLLQIHKVHDLIETFKWK